MRVSRVRALDDDSTTFELRVSLMTPQLKGVMGVGNFNGSAQCHFVEIPQGRVIWPNELSKA
jgi:hypothetical protein